MKKKYKITIVGWRGENIVHYIPLVIKEFYIKSSQNYNSFSTLLKYHGVETFTPPPVLPLLSSLFEEIVPYFNIESNDILNDFVTISIIVNNMVLFYDFYKNCSNFTEEPLQQIGKATILREKLENLLEHKKVKLCYLTQSTFWIEQRQKDFHKLQEAQTRMNVRKLLLDVLHDSNKLNEYMLLR